MPATIDLRQSDPLCDAPGIEAPVIDIDRLTPGNPDRGATVRSIRGACLSPGYFYLSGVIDESDNYRRTRELMRRFFGLDDDDPVKQAVSALGQANTNGWMPKFGEPAYQPGTVAHLESFDCGPPQGTGDSGRANRWPAVDGFREAVTGLWDDLGDAGWQVMRAIADALELDPEFFVARCQSESLSTMRLLHYPPVTEATEAESNGAAVGIAAHTDFECITLIAQTAPGLELLNTDERWRDAPSGDGCLVVLLGDMLERWTNGQILATGHRVRPRSFERFSVVKFFAVDDGVTVAPLPAFVSDERPARYEATGQKAHTRAELERAEANRDAWARAEAN